jgi:hypothetical protein
MPAGHPFVKKRSNKGKLIESICQKEPRFPGVLYLSKFPKK